MILPPAITPSDELAVVLQAAAFGGLVGTAIAARRRARNPDFDAWLVAARWGVALAIAGAVLVVTNWLR